MRRNNSAFIALGALGLYFVWRNRFRFQQFLESRGIHTPTLDTSRLSGTLRSGLAKISGRVENSVRDTDRELKAI